MAFAGQADVSFDDAWIDTRRVGAHKRQRLPRQPLRSELSKAAAEQGLGEARDRQRRHRAEHHGLGPVDMKTWYGRIDEDHGSDPARMLGRLQDRDVPAHGITHEDHRLADDLVDELMHEGRVGAHSGRASEERRLAEAARSIAIARWVMAICGATAIQLRALPPRP